MSKITDYPPGPGINGSEQVLIATPAGPASTNYTYTMTAIKAYAAAGGGGSGTVTSVALVAPDIFTVSGSPVTASGSLTLTAANPGAAADRVVFWDDSAGKWAYLTMGSNLSITGTTLNATGGGGVAWGAISGTLTDQTDLNSAMALKAPLASPTLTGTPLSTTAAVDTNTTQIATTAYVIAQAASATPLANGTAAAGTSTRYARGDHVHTSVVTTTGDILYSSSGVTLSRLAIGSTNQVLAVTGGVPVWSSAFALLASPAFTGTPTAPTASPGTNTTQIATTAYADAIAALKANLASPTFTGTPAAPTAAVDTNTTQLATTAFVVAQAASATPANNGTAAVGTSLRYARGDHVHNSDSTKADLTSPTFTGDPKAPTATRGDADTSIATTAFVRTPSIQSVSSSATVTPTFADDMVLITAQAAALNLANPTGTAIDGLGIVIRIKDNGTARAITYGTQYRAIGVTLPTTTVISKTHYLAMVFNNTDTKWDVLAVGQEA